MTQKGEGRERERERERRRKAHAMEKVMQKWAECTQLEKAHAASACRIAAGLTPSERSRRPPPIKVHGKGWRPGLALGSVSAEKRAFSFPLSLARLAVPCALASCVSSLLLPCA